MLFWKIFAIADVLINLAYWHAILTGRYPLERFDIVFIPVGWIGTIGVISYAFSIPLVPGGLWRVFLPIFIATAAWEIASIIGKEKLEVGGVIGIALVILIAGFTSVAIYRLGGATWFAIWEF